MKRRDLLRAALAGAALLRPRRGAPAPAADASPPVKPSPPPAGAVRSVMRQFTSEIFDKPWFYDRDGWAAYLTMLAGHRFSRLHLAFGLGYDSLQHVADSYLLFAYPFLVAVPGYDVRVTNLPDAERDRNLETLRFVGEACIARGLEFQLGLWMHGYQLADSPAARYVVEGLTPATHAPYCRDALAAVLRECPAISSVALRIHGESGIAEGSYDFWATVFDGATRAGRAVELDLHAKGLDATMIERALATGMPVNVSPKYAAEHLGLPYHQAAIRELEMPVPGRTGGGLMSLSEGARSFTRYGYADFLREDRRYTVRPRVFSGTQRLLAWGDPAWAAAYARSFAFCGMTGVDLMEPLTCRGRRGTAAGTRLGYAEPALAPRWDWQKYDAWYRTWGRLTYDPGTAPAVIEHEIGGDPRGRRLAAGLGFASRILPLLTTAHLPSAACDAYWPEIYWSQPMVAEPRPNPYSDTPSPKTFQRASPLDPALFLSVSDCADELLAGERTARYSPLEVAHWLEALVARAEAELAAAGPQVAPDRLRLALDVAILAALGRFAGAKLRSGVLYAMYERTSDARPLRHALDSYRRARDAWASLVEREKGVYQADLSCSDRFSERGQWADRLAVTDRDVEAMAAMLPGAAAGADVRIERAVAEALAEPAARSVACDHTPPAGFVAGRDVAIELTVRGARARSVRMLYRRVNQALRWEDRDMEGQGDSWRSTIPAPYTDSPYPLQYRFEVQVGPARAEPHPGLGPALTRQPYFILRRR